MKQELRLKMLAASFPSKWSPVPAGMDGTARTLFFGGDQSQRVRISVERCFATRYVKYDFKPCFFSNATYKVLSDATSIFGGASLIETMKHGTATYCEVAADYVGLKTLDHLYFLPYAAATPHGSKRWGPTYYLGSAASDLCISVYDRAAHPDATSSEKAWSRLLRVEARLQGKKLHLVPLQLGKLSNPFLKFRICSPATLHKVFVDEPEIVQLLHTCHLIGSPHAFATKPLNLRKKVMQAAKQNQVGWWKPATLMNNWEKSVSEQLRFNMLGLAPT